MIFGGVPRDEAGAAGGPCIAAILLAAGRSTRMGAGNKLLAEIGGRPMVSWVAEAVLASRATAIVVVTGHQRERIKAALGDRLGDPPGDPPAAARLTLAHNPDYRAGLSTSLHRGLAALPAEVDGALVCLGDMPQISKAVIDRLIAAFDPLEGRTICLPTWRGKRGNPVLVARRFFPEMQAISGDVGARLLIGDYPEAVREVAMDDLPAGQAVLIDVDTPEALAALKPTD